MGYSVLCTQHLIDTCKPFEKEDFMRSFVVCFLLLFAISAHAREISSVTIEESVVTDKGVELRLNGAGIRSKFFFDIYIAQLYMEHPATTVAEILSSNGHKRMVMHFLYEEVGGDKLVDGWNDGFKGNISAEELKAIAPKVEQFNNMFGDIKKGQQIILDYVPESGTKVIFAGEEKGTIAGKDFNDALLLIWLGDKPVTSKLKTKLLGTAK